MAGRELHQNIIGIAGSLRSGSYNRMLLEAAAGLAPEGMQITIFDLGDVPFYNADLDTDERRPARAQELRTAITDADGLLIASPEYNHSVPGVMQNAIDWASRPAMHSSLRHKPVAIMGASGSAVGTARGQQVLKLTLMSTLALVMPHSGVVVANAKLKFSDGRLSDEPTREFLSSFVAELADWVERMRPEGAGVS